MLVSDLIIYPVKSCRGLALSSADARARGLQNDRRAMIVDQNGRFLSQRTHSRMAQIIPDMEDGLHLKIRDKPYRATLTETRRNVSVWRSDVSARMADNDINAALSNFLGQPVTLVMMDADSQRETDPTYAENHEVSFADGFPYLITATASLAALSKTAGEDLSMARFRPNIVIETDEAWAEDDWNTLNIGGITFDIVKPCTRCVMTTLNPKTGASDGDGAMRAMIETRKSPHRDIPGVLFGVNAVARTYGRVSVNDPVRVIA